jgi:hypothetical protein
MNTAHKNTSSSVSSFAALGALGILTNNSDEGNVVIEVGKPTFDIRGGLSPIDAAGKVASIVNEMYRHLIPNICVLADEGLSAMQNKLSNEQPSLDKIKLPILATAEFQKNSATAYFTRPVEYFNILQKLQVKGYPDHDVISLHQDNFDEVEFDLSTFEEVQRSKSSKYGQLSHELKLMKNTLPDIGIPMLVMLFLSGEGTNNGFPQSDLGKAGFPLLNWGENILSDLLNIINTDDEFLRGEMLATLVDGMSDQSYHELANEIRKISLVGKSTADKKKAQATYETYKVSFDRLKEDWENLQKELVQLQLEATCAIQRMIEFIQFKKDEKQYGRDRTTVKPLSVKNFKPDVPKDVWVQVGNDLLSKDNNLSIKLLAPLENGVVNLSNMRFEII